jgi:hypothetical protein
MGTEMTELLEFREKIKLFYSKNEVFILPVLKFILALVVFNTINSRLGYMTRIDNIAVVLIVSLMCSFLPMGAMLVLAAFISLLHMYSLSMEVALVGLCLYLLIFLLYLRFCPKDSIVVLLTPLLFAFKVPYVIPVAMGLLGGPASAVSVGCGVVIYFLFVAITGNAATINTLGEEEAAAKIRLIVDSLLGNKQMMVVIVAFAVTVFVVWLIRRMSVDYSWTIAMVAGIMVDLVILLVGDLLYDTNMSVVNALIGAVAAFVAAKIIEFFRFCVDYSRTEKVQFEDDEYYYYVKAVPKMNVAAQTKTVKRINAQRSTGRNVTTERTAPPRGTSRAKDYNNHYGSSRTTGRSVTIGNEDDDFEEIF